MKKMKKKFYTVTVASLLIAPIALNSSFVFAETLVDEPVVETTTPTSDQELQTTVDSGVAEQETEQSVATPTEPSVDTTTPVLPTEESTSQTEVTSPASPSEIGVIPPQSEDTEVPFISVNTEKMIKLGEVFNPLEGVYASDFVDGDLTSSIVILSNNVDTSIATPDGGTPYQVVYSVTDSSGNNTTVPVEVYVIDDSKFGMLDVSISDFAIAQNDDWISEIEKRIIVKNPDGTTTDPAEYAIAKNGSTGGGLAGQYQISLVVYSEIYHTYTEKTVTITVLDGLTINAADKTVFRSDDPSSFDPFDGVSATENYADGSTAELGAYDGTADMGLNVEGTVDITTLGDYTLTYFAKNSKGVDETKTVTIKVVDSKVTINAENVTIMQGETFNAADYATASDEQDGELPVTVVSDNVDPNTKGTYQVTYEATNSMGTKATKTIDVTVVDRVATIEASDQTVTVGSDVDDAMIKSWAKVSDPVDGDNLPVEFKVLEGKIDTSKAGNVYTVQYSYTNTANNTATKEIKVTVVDSSEKPEEPEVDTPNNNTDTPNNDKNNNGNKDNNVEQMNNKKAKGHANKNELPDTGENNTIWLSVIGLFAIGAALITKRRIGTKK